MSNIPMIVHENREIMFLNDQGKPSQLQRVIINRTPIQVEAIKKIDHLKEMRQGLLIFAAGCAILTLFVFLVLRPFERDMVNSAHIEYQKLLETTKH